MIKTLSRLFLVMVLLASATTAFAQEISLSGRASARLQEDEDGYWLVLQAADSVEMAQALGEVLQSGAVPSAEESSEFSTPLLTRGLGCSLIFHNDPDIMLEVCLKTTKLYESWDLTNEITGPNNVAVLLVENFDAKTDITLERRDALLSNPVVTFSKSLNQNQTVFVARFFNAKKFFHARIKPSFPIPGTENANYSFAYAQSDDLEATLEAVKKYLEVFKE